MNQNAIAQQKIDQAEHDLPEPDENAAVVIGALEIYHGQRGYIYMIVRNEVPQRELSREEALQFLLGAVPIVF